MVGKSDEDDVFRTRHQDESKESNAPDPSFHGHETIRTNSPFDDDAPTDLASVVSIDPHDLVTDRGKTDDVTPSLTNDVSQPIDVSQPMKVFAREVGHVRHSPAPHPTPTSTVVETTMSPRPEMSTEAGDPLRKAGAPAAILLEKRKPDAHKLEPPKRPPPMRTTTDLTTPRLTAAPVDHREPAPAHDVTDGFDGFFMGGYEIVKRLGQGGMALVFLANTPGSGERVVLKKIRASLLSNPKYVKLFRREARIASQLVHDNVVRIVDQAEEAGESFLVMEFLDGLDLREIACRTWAAKHALPLEAVLEFLIGAARGLDYAHGVGDVDTELSGLVHRDISPENLFVTTRGVTKVLDFGIARGRSTTDKLTRTGEVKGKVPYMSPEQIRGEVLDGRSDLFSLAVTGYWLLTGQRPFDGTSNFMTIKRIVEETPTAPSLLNPFIPASVDAVLMKAMAKNRESRFRRAAEFADALSALLRRRPMGTIRAADVVIEAMTLASPKREARVVAAAARPSANWDVDE